MNDRDGNETLASVELKFTERGMVFSAELGYGIPEALLRLLEGYVKLERMVTDIDARLAERGYPNFKKEIEQLLGIKNKGGKQNAPA